MDKPKQTEAKKKTPYLPLQVTGTLLYTAMILLSFISIIIISAGFYFSSGYELFEYIRYPGVSIGLCYFAVDVLLCVLCLAIAIYSIICLVTNSKKAFIVSPIIRIIAIVLPAVTNFIFLVLSRIVPQLLLDYTTSTNFYSKFILPEPEYIFSNIIHIAGLVFFILLLLSIAGKKQNNRAEKFKKLWFIFPVCTLVSKVLEPVFLFVTILQNDLAQTDFWEYSLYLLLSCLPYALLTFLLIVTDIITIIWVMLPPKEPCTFIKKKKQNKPVKKAAPKSQKPADYIGVADELAKYKELLDDGVITQEEFENKKSQLMNL